MCLNACVFVESDGLDQLIFSFPIHREFQIRRTSHFLFVIVITFGKNTAEWDCFWFHDKYSNSKKAHVLHYTFSNIIHHIVVIVIREAVLHVRCIVWCIYITRIV